MEPRAESQPGTPRSGTGIELEAVGLQFEPYRWGPCGVTWDSSRTVVIIKLRRTCALRLKEGPTRQSAPVASPLGLTSPDCAPRVEGWRRATAAGPRFAERRCWRGVAGRDSPVSPADAAAALCRLFSNRALSGITRTCGCMAFSRPGPRLRQPLVRAPGRGSL